MSQGALWHKRSMTQADYKAANPCKDILTSLRTGSAKIIIFTKQKKLNNLLLFTATTNATVSIYPHCTFPTPLIPSNSPICLFFTTFAGSQANRS